MKSSVPILGGYTSDGLINVKTGRRSSARGGAEHARSAFAWRASTQAGSPLLVKCHFETQASPTASNAAGCGRLQPRPRPHLNVAMISFASAISFGSISSVMLIFMMTAVRCAGASQAASSVINSRLPI